MQYANKTVQTSDHLNIRESRKNTLYSKNEDSLPAHISDMGPGAIVASKPKDVLTANNPSASKQSRLCEIGEAPAVPNFQLSFKPRKMFNLLFPAVISEIHVLIFRSETILPGGKLFSMAPRLNPGQWTLCLAEKASVLCRLCAPYFSLSTPTWLAEGKSFPASAGLHSYFSQALFSCLNIKIYRREFESLEIITPE